MIYLHVYPSYNEMSKAAAELVSDRIRARPDSVLGLPTGDSPLGMYKQLVDRFKRGTVSFSQVTTFNLDEYIGVSDDSFLSFKRYMHEHFISSVDLPSGSAHIPASRAFDERQECERYERLIENAGGLDLTILGIGINGHIGFNEPGTPWESFTHAVELDQSTLDRLGPHIATPPRRAITMGIRTIMLSEQLVLMAAGNSKCHILEKALLGQIGPSVPASVLQLHPSVSVLVDSEAGAALLNQMEKERLDGLHWCVREYA